MNESSQYVRLQPNLKRTALILRAGFGTGKITGDAIASYFEAKKSEDFLKKTEDGAEVLQGRLVSLLGNDRWISKLDV
ncbi:MAG: hypothetical protein WCB53_13340 [Terriglobales bacterium]